MNITFQSARVWPYSDLSSIYMGKNHKQMEAVENKALLEYSNNIWEWQ